MTTMPLFNQRKYEKSNCNQTYLPPVNPYFYYPHPHFCGPYEGMTPFNSYPPDAVMLPPRALHGSQYHRNHSDSFYYSNGLPRQPTPFFGKRIMLPPVEHHQEEKSRRRATNTGWRRRRNDAGISPSLSSSPETSKRRRISSIVQEGLPIASPVLDHPLGAPDVVDEIPTNYSDSINITTTTSGCIDNDSCLSSTVESSLHRSDDSETCTPESLTTQQLENKRQGGDEEEGQESSMPQSQFLPSTTIVSPREVNAENESIKTQKSSPIFLLQSPPRLKRLYLAVRRRGKERYDYSYHHDIDDNDDCTDVLVDRSLLFATITSAGSRASLRPVSENKNKMNKRGTFDYYCYDRNGAKNMRDNKTKMANELFPSRLPLYSRLPFTSSPMINSTNPTTASYDDNNQENREERASRRRSTTSIEPHVLSARERHPELNIDHDHDKRQRKDHETEVGYLQEDWCWRTFSPRSCKVNKLMKHREEECRPVTHDNDRHEQGEGNATTPYHCQQQQQQQQKQQQVRMVETEYQGEQQENNGSRGNQNGSCLSTTRRNHCTSNNENEMDEARNVDILAHISTNDKQQERPSSPNQQDTGEMYGDKHPQKESLKQQSWYHHKLQDQFLDRPWKQTNKVLANQNDIQQKQKSLLSNHPNNEEQYEDAEEEDLMNMLRQQRQEKSTANIHIRSEHSRQQELPVPNNQQNDEHHHHQEELQEEIESEKERIEGADLVDFLQQELAKTKYQLEQVHSSWQEQYHGIDHLSARLNEETCKLQQERDQHKETNRRLEEKCVELKETIHLFEKEASSLKSLGKSYCKMNRDLVAKGKELEVERKKRQDLEARLRELEETRTADTAVAVTTTTTTTTTK